jgi:formylglycine-generating enzyme required for sulfatase activity
MDADGKATSASKVVWVKGSETEPKWSEPVGAVKPAGIAPGDREIEVVVYPGYEEVPRTEPDPVAAFHQGRGLKWPATGTSRLYPWRIRHKETGIVLLLVPPGKFWMGSPENEAGRHSDEIMHEVELGEAFYLSETEVTQAQYERVMGTNPSHFKGARLPVESVSWAQAGDFCGRIGCVLPTEAQWEYACRAGTGTAYAFGLELAPNAARFGRKFEEGPVAVRSFLPNGWGFYDMHGNVWEWCRDWHGPYTNLPRAGDGERNLEGSSFRVGRGGGFCDPASCARSADRGLGHPALAFAVLGFRPAKRITP